MIMPFSLPFVTLHQLNSIVTLIISTSVNLILLAIVIMKSSKIGNYRSFDVHRCFAYFYICHNILYSICFTLLTPFWHTRKGFIVNFSLGYFKYNELVVTFFFKVWWACVLGAGIFASLTYIFRYAKLCKPKWNEFLETRNGIIGMVGILWICIWMNEGLAFRVYFNRVPELQKQLKDSFEDELGVDFSELVLIGLNLPSISNINAVIAVFSIHIPFFFTSIFVMVITTHKMDIFIRKGLLSSKSIISHKRAIRMLSFQTANPLMFIYSPFMILSFGFFFGLEHHLITKSLAFIYPLYPIYGGLIIMFFTDEYAQTLLGIFVFTKRRNNVNVANSNGSAKKTIIQSR